MDHRSEWASAWGSSGTTVEIWTREADRCLCTFLLDTESTRALPGFQLVRVDRFGGYGDVDALEAGLAAVTDSVRRQPRVLQVSVGLASPDDAVRARLVCLARGLGYSPGEASHHYGYTSRIDLTRDEDTILAAMKASCRRGIRAAHKNPIEVRPIEDPAVGPILHDLYVETMRRTDGPALWHSWPQIIEYACRNPESARLVGTFSTAGQTGAPLAFAVGLLQGDHVEYRAAATTRSSIQAPLGHALVWDLIRWAKAIGADWFDFGGMPGPEVPPNLAGIVRFKEGFGGETIAFREEWTLVTRPVLSAIRRGLSSTRMLLPRG